MPSHLISPPGVRQPTFGVPLGSNLNYVSVSAVHGSSTKSVVAATGPAVSASTSSLAAPSYVVSRPKTY